MIYVYNAYTFEPVASLRCCPAVLPAPQAPLSIILMPTTIKPILCLLLSLSCIAYRRQDM